MRDSAIADIFTDDAMQEIFPPDKADTFFEALYGDAAEGAYDIGLAYKEGTGDRLVFEFQLTRRPDKCLKCSLTYGLPNVFSRHPIIDLEGIAARIDEKLDGRGEVADWNIGDTREVSSDLHVIPLTVNLK